MATVDHLGFILSAYAAAVLVVAGLVAWVVLDYRAQRRTLADLEARGLTRRSGATQARAEPAMKQAKQDA